MDGVYILQTQGKEGPEYRVSELDDSSDLIRDENGRQVKNIDVLKTNARRLFSSSRVFLDGEEAVNFANMLFDEFKKQGVNFKNGVRIMPPMDFVF